jgi:MotA/TolQ/ExbB proton channel family
MTGGPLFMFPLSLLFFINIGILVYVLIAVVQKKQFNSYWLESIKQIGGLAAAFGTWSTIFGLFMAFDALESSKDIIPFPVIMGGLKVALITVLWGLVIFCLSLFTYIVLKLTTRNLQLNS